MRFTVAEDSSKYDDVLSTLFLALSSTSRWDASSRSVEVPISSISPKRAREESRADEERSRVSFTSDDDVGGARAEGDEDSPRRFRFRSASRTAERALS